MNPNPFTFGPPVPSEENNNLWPQDYSFWSSETGEGSTPWFVSRTTPELYFLQSPNYNGAQAIRQANATLHVCGNESNERFLKKGKVKSRSSHYSEFEGGNMVVDFSADVRIDNGQLFQVVVDGVVQTGGNITTPAVNRQLVVALSPGNHWVEFVYTWYPQADLPTTTTGVVRIFSVTLPFNPDRFPTFSPTDVPSTSPTTTPPTGKPPPRPTVSIVMHCRK